MTPEAVYQLSLMPELGEKGEFATLYHEIHLSIFKGPYYKGDKSDFEHSAFDFDLIQNGNY